MSNSKDSSLFSPLELSMLGIGLDMKIASLKRAQAKTITGSELHSVLSREISAYHDLAVKIYGLA